jgi:hypothetical protein
MTPPGNGLILSFSHVFVASFSKSESSELKSFMESIQSDFIPVVHPKMNSGKESVANAEFGFAVVASSLWLERIGAQRRHTTRPQRRRRDIFVELQYK